MARNRHKSQAPNDTRSRSKSAEPVSDAEPQSDDGVSLPSMAGKVTSQTEAEVTNTKDELQKENESGGVSPTHSQDEHKSHGDSALPEPRSQPQKNVSLPNADAEVSTMNSSTLWQPHQREDSPASQNGGVLIDQGAEEQPQGRVNAARTLHPKASFSDSSSMSGRKTPKERLQLTETDRGASRNRSQARKKKEKNAYLEEKNSERAEFDPRWVHDSESMWRTNPARTSPLTISPGDRSDDQSLSVGNSSSEMLKPRSSLLKDSDSEYENTKSLVLSGNSDDTAASSFRGVPTATMSYAVPWLPHFSGPYPRHFQGSPTPTSQSRGFRGRKNRTDGGEAGPSVYSSKVEEEYSQVGQGLIPTIRVEDFSSQQRVDEYVAAWRPPVSTVQLRGDAESFNPVGNDLRRKIAYLDYYESQNPSLLNAVNSSVVASATGNNFAETPTYHGAQNFTSQDNPLPYSSHQRQNLLSLGSTPFNTRYHGASGQTMPRTHRGSRASRASVAASGGGRATEQDSLIENFQHLGRTGADSQSGLAVHQERPQTPENPDVRAARQNSVDFPFPDDEHPFLQSSPQAQIARNRAAGLDIFGRPLNQSHARLAALREIGYSAEQRAAANQSVLQQRDESQSEQQSSYRPALSVNTSMQNNRDVFGQGGLSSNQELTYGLTPATGGNNELYPRNAFTVVPSQPAAPLGLQGLAPQYGYSPYNQAQIHPQHESQFYQPTQTGGFQPGRTQFGQYHPGQNLTYHYPSGQPASFPTPIGSGRSQVPQHGQTQRGPQRSGYSQFAPSPLDPTPPIQPPYAPPQYPTSSILAPHVPGLPPSAFGGFHPYVPYPGFAEPTGTSTWDPNPPPREAGPDQLGGLRSIWDTVPNLIHPRAPVPGERVHFNEVATAIPRGLTNHPALANVTAETSTSQSPANVTPTTRLAARSTNVTSATSNATPGIIARPATSTVSTAANVTSERGTAPPATNVRSATSITPTAGNLRSARSVALPATTGVVLRLAMLPSDPDWVHPVLRDIAAGNGRLAGAAALQRPYHPGTDAMFPVPSVQGTSVRLQQLIRDGEPSYEKAILPDFFPYIESAKAAEPHKWGVIKITNVSSTLLRQCHIYWGILPEHFLAYCLVIPLNHEFCCFLLCFVALRV